MEADAGAGVPKRFPWGRRAARLAAHGGDHETMRTFVVIGVAGLVAASLVGCGKAAPKTAPASATVSASAPSGALNAQQIPHRAPGLWRQTISMDGAPANGPGMQLCVDQTSEARMSLAAQQIPGAKCAQPRFSRDPDGTITFASRCDMGKNGSAQTSGTIKGDFNSHYTANMDTTYAGSPVPAMNGKHAMVITATRVGPCAPGERGGDVILPNGTKHNLLDREGPLGSGR